MIEDKKYTVYRHITPSNKVYIGITKQNPKKRWQNGHGYKKNEHFYRAILKYGWENIKHEIICQASLSSAQAGAVEKSFIHLYDSTNPDKGYNNSIGGEYGSLGVHPSKETREKLRKKATNPSEETRKKLSEARKGKKLSEETKRKIGQKTKETHTGMKYKRHKKCTYGCKKIICLDTGYVYESITEAEKSTGISMKAISNALRGKSKAAGGYHWKYVEEQS